MTRFFLRLYLRANRSAMRFMLTRPNSPCKSADSDKNVVLPGPSFPGPLPAACGLSSS